MNELFLTIYDAAQLLGVSIQTLRNWDESNYFSPSRTVGGHRRYLKSDIDEFIKGKKRKQVVSCWEIEYIENAYNRALEEAGKDPRAKECGGFSKEEIGLLIKNQDNVHDEDTKKLPIDLLYEIASSFSSPYLFHTCVLININTLVFYHRIRERSETGEKFIVCESEDVCSSTYKEDFSIFGEDLLQKYQEIVKNVDIDNIKAVINNAGTLFKSEICDIESTIANAIDAIDEKTNTKEPKFVIFPPELMTYKGNFKRLNDNLKIDMADRGYKAYCSRLVPDNKIIVGIKSNNGFNGYAFCPFLLMCKETKKDKIMMMIGKKLLREGSKNYALITVE